MGCRSAVELYSGRHVRFRRAVTERDGRSVRHETQGMRRSLNAALDVVFAAKLRAGLAGLALLVSARLISVGPVLGVGFLLVVSLVFDTAITFVGYRLFGAPPLVIAARIAQTVFGVVYAVHSVHSVYRLADGVCSPPPVHDVVVALTSWLALHCASSAWWDDACRPSCTARSERGDEARSELCQLILHMGRHRGDDVLADQTVPFQVFQGQRLHALGNPADVVMNITVTLAFHTQCAENLDRPFVSDSS